MATSKLFPKPSAPRPADPAVEEKKRLVPAILADETPGHRGRRRIRHDTLLKKLGNTLAAEWAIHEMVEVDHFLKPILPLDSLAVSGHRLGQDWESIPFDMGYELEETPAIWEYWRELQKPNSVQASDASKSHLPVGKAGKPSGQTDTSSDTAKKSGKKKRPVSALVGACAEHVRKMMSRDETASRTQCVRDFMEERASSFKKPASFKNLYRTLSDHPDLWQPKPKSDKSRTRTASEN